MSPRGRWVEIAPGVDSFESEPGTDLVVYGGDIPQELDTSADVTAFDAGSALSQEEIDEAWGKAFLLWEGLND